MDSRTPLEKHMDYLGGEWKKDGGISRTSMAEKNQQLGDSWWAAQEKATIVSAGAGVKIKGCPFALFQPKEAVGVLNHTKHTGIFNIDGTINEEVWNQIKKYARDMSGTPVLLKPDFDLFLAERRKQENSSSQIDEILSDGEWGNYWSKFSEKNDYGIPYVPLQKLRDFFEDSSIPGIEVEQKVSHKSSMSYR